MLFILNPKSGVGKARETFQNKVVPVLTEADVNYDLHVTRHAHDAQNVVRTQVCAGRRNFWQGKRALSPGQPSSGADIPGGPYG